MLISDDPHVEIALRFRLTRYAHLRWQIHHQLRTPFLHVVAIAMGCMFVTFSKTAPEAVVAFLFGYLATWLVQLLSIVIMILPARNPRLLTDYSLDLVADGLRASTPHVDSFYRWSGVIRVVEGFGVVAVYTTVYSACIIPTSAFSGSEEKRRFISSINARRTDA